MDQSKILSFCNAKIRGEVCEFLQNLGGGIISAQNLKVKSASQGKTGGGMRVCANFGAGIISATILKVRSASSNNSEGHIYISGENIGKKTNLQFWWGGESGQ